MPDIQFLGHACFRIRGRDGVVLMDPVDRTSGYDIGKPTASIVTVSHPHDDHNNTSVVKPLKESLNIFTGPGEYEVGGILVTGVRTYHDKKMRSLTEEEILKRENTYCLYASKYL